ncbi:MAG: hypothetical protein KGJ35_00670 [Patescibacteria group bacterium]|nr:hypothetical protein [Patescibacteria group bacterium]
MDDENTQNAPATEPAAPAAPVTPVPEPTPEPPAPTAEPATPTSTPPPEPEQTTLATPETSTESPADAVQPEEPISTPTLEPVTPSTSEPVQPVQSESAPSVQTEQIAPVTPTAPVLQTPPAAQPQPMQVQATDPTKAYADKIIAAAGQVVTPEVESLFQSWLRTYQEKLGNLSNIVRASRKKKHMDRIVELAGTKDSVTLTELRLDMRMSKQQIERYLKQLVAEGRLCHTGAAHEGRYKRV